MIQGKRADEQVVHDLYGDYLYDRRDFTDAAVCKPDLELILWTRLIYQPTR